MRPVSDVLRGVTGDGVLDLLNKYIYNVKQTSELLKIGSLDELVKRVAQLVGENKEKDRGDRQPARQIGRQ